MHAPLLPKPVLFHPLKHHLGYIREFVRQGATATEAALRTALQTIGRSQLDFYTGPLLPEQLAAEVLGQLQEQQVLAPAAYRQYLQQAATDYRLLTLSDGSTWVLRWGLEEERHVHLHPARYATHTTRLKANALKTAVAVAVYQQQHPEQPVNLALINQLRREWLGLSPVKGFDGAEEGGAAGLLKLIRPFQHI
ncbi:hypothetical protein [Pontibacter beigongshangensis]|uniref:hypothetical protein n=1 Tax=Pontibacter beigongshangensis TaxID=2574733 RepID=UPI00164F6428|nr:hypothetical protein [Pontibacter beigongshangensis]